MANNVFQAKRTSVAGRTPNTTGSYATNTQYIAAGEFALNMADGILYSSNGSAVITVGANLVNQRITNSFAIDNTKLLRFQTVNALAYANFTQQADDNFVFYTTNTAYGSRAVWSIFANSVTSNMNFSVPVNFNANIGIGTGAAIYANGLPGTAGQLLTSNGTTVYWSSPGAASVNVAAQYAWTNTHTFSANVAFTGNNISLVTNTGSVLFNGAGDANWKIGRNTGGTTKFFYTGNTVDIIAANSSLEGIAFGYTGNAYLETGYAGTFTQAPLYVGNTTQNVSTTNTTIKIQANTTVNSTYTASLVQVSNSTSTANLSALDLKIGATSTVNGSQITSDIIYAVSSANIASSIIANSSGLYPTSNIVGFNLGNANQRWTVTALSGAFASFVTMSSAVTMSTTTSNINAVAQTTGSLNLGGPTQTGSILLGQSTANQTVSIANGATTSGNVKVLELGTLGAAGSQTNITVGTSLSNTLLTVNANNALFSGIINAAAHTVGTTFIANTTQITIASTPLSANGGTGSAGQVLTSNGATGSPYWSTVTGGSVNVAAQYTWTNTHTFQNAITFSSNVTIGAVTTANTSGVFPSSNTIAFGNTIGRWAIVANTIDGTGDWTTTGNVGFGAAASASYKLIVNGAFAATTKSFVIPHPSNSEKFLRYGSLEGPENGVYVRGKLVNERKIYLPYYWTNLVDEDTITVNITPTAPEQEEVWVLSTNSTVIELNQLYRGFYTVFAERKDVEKLVVEF